MTSPELGSSWRLLFLVVVSSTAMLVGIILYVRIAGLRSFSKMSAFDFAVTVAFGSILGAVALSGSSLAEGLVATGTLLSVQTVVAFGRSRFALGRLVDNTPVLLVANGRMLTDHLRATRVTTSDINAAFRRANVSRLEDVSAVVLETTGRLSVVHGHSSIDLELFEDVAGSDRLGG